MKSVRFPTLAIALLSTCLLLCSHAAAFSTSSTSPLPRSVHFTHTEFLGALHDIKVEVDRRQDSPDHIAFVDSAIYYYARVRVMKTNRDLVKGGVSDCIPFLEQPALIDADEASRKEAEALDAQVRRGVDGKVHSPTFDRCPEGTVEIARPVVVHDAKTGVAIDLREPPKKIQRPPHHHKHAGSGYHYVVSPNKHTDGSLNANVVLGVGDDVNAPVPVCPADGESHTLNQMWWSNIEASNSSLQTLETGWMVSNYFTSDVALTLFVFGTIDDYGNSPTNKYNTAGGFIMYSGGTSIGTSVSDVRHLTEWAVLSKDKGYSLWLKKFERHEDGTYKMESTWNAVGYYPKKRYGSSSSFHILQCGQEVYKTTGADNVTAGGKIYGWGPKDTVFSTTEDFDGTRYQKQYVASDWDNKVGTYTNDHYVEFYGSG